MLVDLVKKSGQPVTQNYKAYPHERKNGIKFIAPLSATMDTCFSR